MKMIMLAWWILVFLGTALFGDKHDMLLLMIGIGITIAIALWSPRRKEERET